MKKYLTTIITLGVLVLAVVALFVVKALVKDNDTPSTPSEDPESSYQRILGFDDDEIAKIETFYNENYVIEKQEDEWVLTSHTFDAYPSSISSAVLGISEAEGYKIENVDKLSDYGFGSDLSANPHVIVTKTDGTKYELYVGDMDYSQYFRYIYLNDGSNTVYKSYLRVAEDLMLTKESLIRLKAFAYAYNDEPIYFLVKKDGEKVLELDFKESVVDEQQGTIWNWTVQYPVQRDCQNTEANEIIQAMRNIDLGGISNEAVPESELVNFGLAPAKIEYYLYMQSVEGVRTLYRIRIGNKTESGDFYYCTVDDVKDGKIDVYTVHEGNVYRNINPLDYIDTFLYIKDSDLLGTIEFTVNGESHEFKYTYEQDGEETVTTRYFDGRECPDNDEYSVVGNDSLLTPPTEEQLARNKDLDITNDIVTVNPYDAFNRVLTSLYSNLVLSEIIADEPAEEEKGPVIALVKYTETDGTVTEIKLFKRDNTTAWAYINGSYAGGYCRTTALFGDDYMNFDFAASLKGLKAVMALVP